MQCKINKSIQWNISHKKEVHYTKLMNPGSIMLSEIVANTTYCMIPFLGNAPNRQIYRDRGRRYWGEMGMIDS